MVEQREIEMFGMTTACIREDYMNGITAKLSGLEMVVMGILSDAQECAAMGAKDEVRKQLNIAKFILCEMQEAKR